MGECHCHQRADLGGWRQASAGGGDHLCTALHWRDVYEVREGSTTSERTQPPKHMRNCMQPAAHSISSSPARYNGVLRSYSQVPKQVEEFERLCLGNTYTSTLHAINSATIKLAAISPVAKCYRGISGGVLPEQFWHADQFRIRGGVEFGFTSATYERDVATQYASHDAGISTILEIQTGMVNRAASLKWLSQYPCVAGDQTQDLVNARCP